MKKKLLILLLGLILILPVLGACDRNDDSDEYNEEEVKTEEIEEIEDEEPEQPEEEEPEKTEEEEPEDDLEIDTGDLSDDLYSFQLMLNGEIFTLPFAFEELYERGWSNDNIDDQTLNPNTRTLSDRIHNGEQEISVAFINTGENVLALRYTNVGRISISQRQLDSFRNDAEVIFPGGITIGSTEEEVIALHGEPSEYRETALARELSYYLDIYDGIRISIDIDTNLVSEMTMTNFFAVEELPQFEGDLPAAVLAYEAPTDLGNDLMDFNVRFAGDLYTLPAPVNAFLENGWILVTDPNTMIDAMGFEVGVRLRKGNQVMRTSVRNYDDSQQPLSHSWVTTINFYEFDAVLPIELANGITENSTLGDLEAAFGEPVEESGMFTRFQYGEFSRETTVSWHNDDGRISRIGVENSPRSLD